MEKAKKSQKKGVSNDSKKHKLKKKILPHIDGDFDVLAADLSLRRPGFAIVHYYANERKVRLIKKTIINNKDRFKNKPAPKCLQEIADLFDDWAARNTVKVFVRERAIRKFNAETHALQRVCGVTDYLLWVLKEEEWQEMAISSVKKLVAGNGYASKPQVAKHLEPYVGIHRYHSDDETDAVAVAIGWLIQNGYIDSKVVDDEESLKEIVYDDTAPIEEEYDDDK